MSENNSRAQGNVDWVKGAATAAAGAVTGSQEQQQAGYQQMEQGQQQVDAAKNEAYKEAVGDNIAGKVQSGIGIVTGDQDKQREGNIQSQRAEVTQAINDPAGLASYIPKSFDDLKDRVAGKVESAWGMITGDQERQTKGNLKDTAANVHDTVNKALGSDSK